MDSGKIPAIAVLLLGVLSGFTLLHFTNDGLTLDKAIESLPQQHLLIFRPKREGGRNLPLDSKRSRDYSSSSLSSSSVT